MKHLLSILLISSLFGNITNNGATVTIGSDVSVFIDGNFINNGNLTNEGFLETSGLLINSQLFENLGTLIYNNNLLDFDGLNDNVKFGVNTFDEYDIGSISVNFKANDIISNGHIYNFENVFILKVENSLLRIEFNKGNDSFNYISTPIDNNWNFAKIKWTENQGQLFLNHNLVGFVDFNDIEKPDFEMYDRDSSIGSRFDAGNNFNGHVNNLMLSNYDENEFYGIYLFNTGEENILYDYKNSNHGNINGASWYVNTQLGDLNFDLNINVQDIIVLVDIIINIFENYYIPTDQELEFADIYEDGQLNVIDIVALVNIVLEQ